VQRILDLVRRIEESGRACIYIEHNLAHVHELADRLVVLDRDPKGEMWLAELAPT
jgi:simple sugar transport system ATP-binding protein